MKKDIEIMDSPIGPLVLVGTADGLEEIYWRDQARSAVELRAIKYSGRANATLKLARRQLEEYFARRRTRFDIPLSAAGTDFQKKVWRELRKIPYGTSISYQELATRVGDARKARAVGGANGKNPLPIVVPCHRVIGKSGKLTGFAGGLELKEFLLNLERLSGE